MQITALIFGAIMAIPGGYILENSRYSMESYILSYLNSFSVSLIIAIGVFMILDIINNKFKKVRILEVTKNGRTKYLVQGSRAVFWWANYEKNIGEEKYIWVEASYNTYEEAQNRMSRELERLKKKRKETKKDSFSEKVLEVKTV
jgi:hypothetical protein